MIFCHQPCHHQRLRKMRWNITGNIQTQDPEKPADTAEILDALQIENETTPKKHEGYPRGREDPHGRSSLRHRYRFGLRF